MKAVVTTEDGLVDRVTIDGTSVPFMIIDNNPCDNDDIRHNTAVSLIEWFGKEDLTRILM